MLAAADAIAWPLLWVVAVLHAPAPVGVVGPVVTAGAALIALNRLRRAVWENHRYRFATWRWGRVVLVLLFIGVVMKLMLPS
jgi:hypothetical protein